MTKLISIFFLFFISCTPQKRLQRLVEKHPELIQKDTIHVIDTVTTETLKADTVFSTTHYIERLRDTIRIVNDRLTVTQYINNDSIFIEGECKGDTIISVIPVEVETVNNIISNKIPRWIWFLFGGVVLISILALIKRR